MHEFIDEEGNFKDTLTLRFKESALKAFLCRATSTYSSFSLVSLMTMFEISESKLIQIASRMIIKNKIPAHIDVEKKLLVIDTRSSEVKELLQLSLQYVDKMEIMIENNERLLDIMSGGTLYGYKERT